jgi:hypothetical protein
VSVEQVEAFECPGCGVAYEDEWVARRCCPSFRVSVWKCSVCEELFRRQDDAESCHRGATLCVCGCPPNWHTTGRFLRPEGGELCNSPGCECAGFEWEKAPAVATVPKEQGVLL